MVFGSEAMRRCRDVVNVIKTCAPSREGDGTEEGKKKFTVLYSTVNSVKREEDVP